MNNGHNVGRIAPARAPRDPSAKTSGGAAPATGPVPWGALVSDDQWNMFTSGIDALDAAGIPFVLHGAMGLAAYTGRWRNTKDVDVIVHERDRERAVEALKRAGFDDYFERETYDRSWIFRGYKEAGIFDVIWALPNHRVVIDEPWFARARPLQVRDRMLKAAPPEEIMRVKLYVLQRGRCDWPDVLNILSATVEQIDWRWLVRRMGPDLPLLHGLLAVFNWLSPERARRLPRWVRTQFALIENAPGDPDATERLRVPLVESRPWFALHQPPDKLLER
jgi:hypothetical protein